MNRTLAVALASLAGLSVATPAMAMDPPYMWGVGAKVGTIVVPGQFPLAWPSSINNYNFIDEEERNGGDPDAEEPKRDLDDSGNPRYTSLTRVKTDVQFSLDGFYGLDAQNRVGAIAGLATGKNFNDVFFMFAYDRVMFEDTIDVIVGGSAGFGSMKFGSEDDVEELKIPYYPLRVRGMAQARFDTFAVGLGLFAQSSVPGTHNYTNLDGEVVESVGSPFNVFLYLSAGLELSVQFGDFKPPKNPKKKKKGKKGKKGGKKGGGGKS